MNKKREKNIKRSSLENIKGIGKAKAKLLLKGFRSINDIKKATIEEIAKIKGIAHKDAENIYEYFRKQ